MCTICDDIERKVETDGYMRLNKGYAAPKKNINHNPSKIYLKTNSTLSLPCFQDKYFDYQKSKQIYSKKRKNRSLPCSPKRTPIYHERSPSCPSLFINSNGNQNITSSHIKTFDYQKILRNSPVSTPKKLSATYKRKQTTKKSYQLNLTPGTYSGSSRDQLLPSNVLDQKIKADNIIGVSDSSSGRINVNEDNSFIKNLLRKDTKLKSSPDKSTSNSIESINYLKNNCSYEVTSTCQYYEKQGFRSEKNISTKKLESINRKIDDIFADKTETNLSKQLCPKIKNTCLPVKKRQILNSNLSGNAPCSGSKN